ncbi:MAG: septal ring lytic transglycosylase RlpA family protein [Candidatus Hydrogenedentota bacterium]|nr:MAG: septal ring lytic transglycosylase RlpA family protein [Candidatus Hydrogenedentota bacterium]
MKKVAYLFMISSVSFFCQAPQTRKPVQIETREKSVDQNVKVAKTREVSDEEFFSDKVNIPEKKEFTVQTGYASWYGKEMQGRPTASGELFDMNQFTAAHRTFPMGSIVLIKNLENGKKQLVRINDRGPYVDGRIIDVSYATAKALGFAKKGVAKVSVELIQKGKDNFLAKAEVDKKQESEPKETYDDEVEDPQSEAAGFLFMDGLKPKGYTIQVGAFKRRANAEKFREELEDRYNRRTFIATEGKWHYVWLGDFKTADAARKMAKRLRRDGYEVFYRGKVLDTAL